MSRLDNIGKQFFDGNGEPLAGGKLFFYETGTTTLSTTYSDSALSSANANPVILDAEGRMPDVFYSGQLKIILRDSNDVLIETRDPVGFLATSGLPPGGTTTQVLAKASNDDYDVEWADAGGGGGSDYWTFVGIVEAENFTAVAGNYYLIPIDAASTLTVTLPASPSQDDRVGIRRDGSGTTQINRNGSTIEGSTEVASAITVGAAGFPQKYVELIYKSFGPVTGWYVINGALEIAA